MFFRSRRALECTLAVMGLSQPRGRLVIRPQPECLAIVASFNTWENIVLLEVAARAGPRRRLPPACSRTAVTRLAASWPEFKA